MKKLIIPILVVVTMFLGLYAVCQAQQSGGEAQEPAMQAKEPTGEMQQPAMQAQKASELEVSVAAICKDVVDHEPVDSGNSFTAVIIEKRVHGRESDYSGVGITPAARIVGINRAGLQADEGGY